MTADQLTAPIDWQRGDGAAWHLIRCLQWLGAAEQFAHPLQTHIRDAMLQTAGKHLRTARGYLGAVGFERGGRL